MIPAAGSAASRELLGGSGAAVPLGCGRGDEVPCCCAAVPAWRRDTCDRPGAAHGVSGARRCGEQLCRGPVALEKRSDPAPVCSAL